MTRSDRRISMRLIAVLAGMCAGADRVLVLPVRVRDRNPDGTVLVEPAEGHSFRARAPLEPLTGSAALVMIRPTGVRLTPNGSDERHLSGRVTDVASATAATSTPSTSTALPG